MVAPEIGVAERDGRPRVVACQRRCAAQVRLSIHGNDGMQDTGRPVHERRVKRFDKPP